MENVLVAISYAVLGLWKTKLVGTYDYGRITPNLSNICIDLMRSKIRDDGSILVKSSLVVCINLFHISIYR